MATRFYLPATAAATPISPTPDADWEDTSILARANLSTSKIGDTLTSVSFSDSDTTNKDVLWRQWISGTLTAGQTITGAQLVRVQAIIKETGSANNNMFLAVGVRIINGSTVNKTVMPVTRDNSEASAITSTNRSFAVSSAAGNYTTVTGDRIVLEIGLGGDPLLSASHSGLIFLGDSGSSDLPTDDSSTDTTLNPWFELVDTLTFGSASGGPFPFFRRAAMSGGMSKMGL